MQHTRSMSRCIGDLTLTSGEELADVSLAYSAYGQLNGRGDNAVLITHGLTSGHSMLDSEGGSEGSWADLLKPGRALDASRYYVVCSNVIGSSFGSTGPASLRPGSPQPWGPDFPQLTLSDMVLAQKRLLQSLGVTHLVAVAGPSFGGMQALQWALDHPDWVSCAASVVSGLRWPRGLGSKELLQRFEGQADWQQGRYAIGQDMRECMYQLRVETLLSYGIKRVLEDRAPLGDMSQSQGIFEAGVRRWAAAFDPNALLALYRAGERFNAYQRLGDIRCPVLFAPASSDGVFPPDKQDQADMHQAWGDRLIWCEIETPYGHLASGMECAKWEPSLRRLLQQAIT